MDNSVAKEQEEQLALKLLHLFAVPHQLSEIWPTSRPIHRMCFWNFVDPNVHCRWVFYVVYITSKRVKRNKEEEQLAFLIW